MSNAETGAESLESTSLDLSRPGEYMLYVKELLFVFLLIVVVVGSVGDIFHDYREGASTGHMAVEALLVAASFVLIAILSVGIFRQSRSLRALKEELKAASGSRPDEALAAPPSLLTARHGLAEVVKEQFEAWGLTQTEKEVAMLMLKGLSFKEIAAVRDTLEKTVRQQASAIYRKAGVSGRHAFAAWFIEDLF
jgi:DNA-binding CsgD family transcriptional regulator